MILVGIFQLSRFCDLFSQERPAAVAALLLAQLPASAGWLCPLLEPVFWTLLGNDQTQNQAWAKRPDSAKIQVSSPQPLSAACAPEGFPRLPIKGMGPIAVLSLWF